MADGPDFEALIEEAGRLQQIGEMESAMECLRQAEAAASGPAELSLAIRRQAVLFFTRSEWDRALETVRLAGQVASESGLQDLYAEACNVEGVILQGRGNFPGATAVFEQILGMTSDAKIRGQVLQNLGAIAAQQGNWELARRRFQQSAKSFQRAGYVRGEAMTLNNFGRAAVEFGNVALAADLLEQARGAARRVGDMELLAMATMNYAEAITGQDRLGEAEELVRSALSYFEDSGNAWRRVECLRLCGDIALKRGDRDGALETYRKALEIAKGIGAEAEAGILAERVASVG
ncbi:MAG TPA: tetratricopeptide repeat protein [Gemmatimonadaceae bacterium]|nr:tetratricopeptide repeat protein [Gemmatimonadaceae bacterium]